MKRLTICMVIVTMLTCLGAATAQDTAEGETWADRVGVSGYFQFRYVNQDGPGLDDEFQFRRMFITMRAQIDDRSTGIICLSRVGAGTDPNIDLYLAFLDYRLDDEYTLMVGQAPTFFGLETWEVSRVRLPFERAKILEAGPGFYFQGGADRGAWIRRAPQTPEEPMIVFGLCNGQFRANNANDDLNVELHLKWRQDWGQYGASWFDGRFEDAGGVTDDRSAVALYARKFADPWGAQFEWADGNLMGASRDGWYLQGMYDFEDGKNIAFARYEEFNARVDDANRASFDAWTVGVQHRVYDSGHIKLQYTNGDWSRTGTVDGRTGDARENLLGLQWQYEFR